MANKYLDYAGLQRLVANIDKKYAKIEALVFKGSVQGISNLPNLAELKAGWMYNVTVGGGTTSDFIEGAGHIVGDGENVAVVELITGYTAVEAELVTVDKDPKALDWFESNGEVTPTYIPSADRIADTTKTYYTANTVKKWDMLGGIFDFEDRYLEFGTEFPENPVDGRTYLYMGDNTYTYEAVSTPEGRPTDKQYYEKNVTYEQATVDAEDNPKELGLYEYDSVSGSYTLTEDETPVVDNADPENPVAKVYYTQNVTYTLSTDAAVDGGKTYYTKESEYKTGVIYKYDGTEREWVGQSSGASDDMVAITAAEVDELFY